MPKDTALEALNRRFEELVLHKSQYSLSELERRQIARKFENKSLQELQALVGALEKF